MVVVGGDDHDFVLQLGVRAFDEREHVAVGDDVAVDGGGEGDVNTLERDGLVAALGLRGLREVKQRSARAAHHDLGQGRRDLSHRNAHAVGPAREREAIDPRRLRRPECARRGLEVGGARMVMDVGDE